jgi:ABC-type phosphate transport system substrate-binding protein
LIFNLYPAVYNNLEATTGDIQFTSGGSDDAISRLAWGEIDFALVSSSIMRQDLLTPPITAGQIYQLPLFASRFVLIYSLPTMTSADLGIILDYNTMSDIWMGRITNWNDPRIAALNPSLAAQGRLINLNITRIAANSGDREIEKIYFGTLNSKTAGTKSAYNLSRDSYNGMFSTKQPLNHEPSLSSHLYCHPNYLSIPDGFYSTN